VVLYDAKSDSGITVIDLGAGHSSQGETLSGRVITTLKSRALLNESPGAGYLERRWAEPFRKSGAWPVSALRQAFLNGTLERLLDPDSYLKSKLPEFVLKGDFGYASGAQGDGYSRVWFKALLPQEEISFDSDVYLLLAKRAMELKSGSAKPIEVISDTSVTVTDDKGHAGGNGLFTQRLDDESTPTPTKERFATITIRGDIPTEVWNRLGRTLIPKLKSGDEVSLKLDVSVRVEQETAQAFRLDLMQILRDLNLADSVKIEVD